MVERPTESPGSPGSPGPPGPPEPAVPEIRGHRIPKRRFTAWALYYVLLYVGLPVLVLGLLADAVLYFVFTGLLGRCYALFCLFL